MPLAVDGQRNLSHATASFVELSTRVQPTTPSPPGAARYAPPMTEIREIDEDELERWVATTKAALDEADTVEGYLDWKRQARETIWLLASRRRRATSAAAIGIGGWHSPDGVARGEVAWSRDARGAGLGHGACSASSRPGRAGSATAS